MAVKKTTQQLVDRNKPSVPPGMAGGYYGGGTIEPDGGGAVDPAKAAELERRQAVAAAGKAKLAAQEKQKAMEAEAAAAQARNRDAIGAAKAYGTTYAPEGTDQTNQGVGEQTFDIHGDEYFDKGSAEKWSDANRDVYGQAGFGQTTNQYLAGKFGADADSGAGQQYWDKVAGRFNKGGSLTRDAYDSFDASVDPNLGGYYNNAFNVGAGQINDQLSARGQFGSTVGMQQLGMFGANLGAERANREAQYGLDRFGARMDAAGMASRDEMDWLNSGGSMAFAAGDARRADLGAAGDAATTSEKLGFERLGARHDQLAQDDIFKKANRDSGFAAAFGAQDQRDERVQEGFQNRFDVAAALSGIGIAGVNKNYDAETTEAETGLAQGADEYNIKMAEIERQRQAFQQAIQAGGTYAGAYDWKKPEKK